MRIMVLEISINLGRGFSALSELSILKSCIPPTLRKGSKIRPRDNIPNPPIHWIIALQRRMGLSLISRSEIIVDPVVVSPETASKIASIDESDKTALEKIILIHIPTDVYPVLYETFIYLFKQAGLKDIKIEKEINFEKMYNEKKKN